MDSLARGTQLQNDMVFCREQMAPQEAIHDEALWASSVNGKLITQQLHNNYWLFEGALEDTA
jgi:hypothetical protein